MKNYVKKFCGHDVPVGATHFVDDSPSQREGFYKWDANELMFFSVGNYRGWVESIRSEIPDSAIELPEEPKSEWMPEVGDECEMLDDRGQWVAVNIFAEYDGFIHGWHKERTTPYYSNDLSEFRPLKTQQEKDREAFINTAIRSIDTTKFSIGQMDIVSKVINQLAVARFIAPKGEGDE